MLHDALYRTVVAGGIAPFEDHQNFLLALNQIPLQFHQLNLQLVQPFLVLALGHLLHLAHRSLSPLPPLSSNSLTQGLNCKRPGTDDR
jgi:hypothetical protein